MPFRPALGTSDFQKLRESGADYVDKTSWIAGVLEDHVEILLFSRPRRFGKTLNLSTLRYFVEKSPANLSAIFDDLEIWQNPHARAHFQRYPVAWITFKDVKFNTWALTFAAIRTEIQRMYEAHRYLLEEGTLVPEAVERFKTILRREGPEELYSSALKDLTAHLACYHGERVVILIDEYDIPIQAGFTYGFYDQVVLFFRAFFSAGLKDNPHVFKGVLTGILRIARESLFSGLNNIIGYSILTKRHGTAFGFTEPEVARILEAERYPERMDAVRRWYNGYLFGGQTIYNPWSVLSYVSDEEHRLRPWWLMTSSDDLLRELMLTRGYGLNADMEELLRGGTIEKQIDETIVLRDVEQRADALWSFLLFSGYLKPVRLRENRAKVFAHLAIPNGEVMLVYEDVFQDWMARGMETSDDVNRLTSALLRGDVAQFEGMLSHLLLRNLSYQDPGSRQPERLYHGFILGLLVSLEGQYEVRSNRESGYGRADVLIRPKQPGKPGVVLELKVLEDGESIGHALSSALAQIRERKYVTELEAAGASPVLALGAVFDGKRAWVKKG